MVISEKTTNQSNLRFGESDQLALLSLCYQCSSCTSACPLRRVSKFNPRRIIHRFQIDGSLEEDDLTSCLTCGLCLEVCPQQVDFPEFIRQSRCIMGVNEENYAHHNIFNLLQVFMVEMTDSGMQFEYEGEIDSESEVAYFPGCIDLFDKFLDLKNTNFHQIGQSAINVINKTGLKPNLISLKCCGHDAYWTGDEEVYEQVKDYNTTIIEKSGIKKLIVSCAECYYTFEKLYKLENVEIQHLSQYIDENKEKLLFNGEKIKITYHDACRLGRYMKDYDSPRSVIQATGMELKELPSNKQFSKCCGVSAWLKCDDKSRTVMLQKLEDATSTVGNEGTLAVSCTKCFAHLNCVLEDKQPQHNFKIQVKEIGTIVDELSEKK
ncbi:MAG: (Fe-S)-binding protein [Candidatus Hodarchaeales archaeon]